MKYYVVLTVRFWDGMKDSVSIYTYESKDDEIASFHKNLGSWMQKENVAHILCVAMDEYGVIYKNEHWDSPEPKVEPVPEVEEE